MTKVIKSDHEYEKALVEIEALVEEDPDEGTEAADRLELLALLVSHYEDANYPIELPDPISAIRFRMDQMSLKQRDLVPYKCSPNKVY